MTYLLYFIWNANPEIISGLPPRWYGVLFASGFIVGSYIMRWMYKLDKRDPEEVERLTMYMVISTIVGARIGHCLFYDPVYYLSNPLKILFIWEGGLASHGAAIAIILGMVLYSRKVGEKFFWVMDRIVIVVCLAGAFIRTGNFMNSEILGLPTETKNGVIFAKSVNDILSYRFDGRVDEISFHSREGEINDNGVPITIRLKYVDDLVVDEEYENNYYESNVKSFMLGYDGIKKHIYEEQGVDLDYKLFKNKNIYYAEIYTIGIPRHPAQMYEALYCFLLFVSLLSVWYFKRQTLNDGFIFSIFMIVLWTLRIFDELLKENQVAWEDDIPFNMGQWLSVPMIILGIYIFIKTFPNKKSA
jgi:prolipoprotein diacylglyceryltransferase